MRARESLLVVLLATGCRAAPSPRAAAPTPELRASEPRRDGVTVQAEIGALDEDKTLRAFKGAQKKLTACYLRGAERVAYLSGTVAFYVRVAGDGSTRYAVIQDSSLGDRQTEDCMLGVLRATSWPKPMGGAEGECRSDFHFDASGEEREPVEGSPGQLGPPLQKARPMLQACRKRVGAGPMKATLYVESDGKPVAIGVSAADEKGEQAAPCVVDVLRGLQFPSPGSFTSKVSVPID